MSKVVFNPRAKIELKKLSKPVKRKVGELLLELEKGKILKMPHSRAMSSVANGVSELRVKDENGIYRVFYYLKVKNKILVFHVFKKKTMKTPDREIKLGRERLKETLESINEKT